MKELDSQLFQTLIRPTTDPDIRRIFVRQNNFIAGDVHLSDLAFLSCQRSAKNLFHLFGTPGLGINAEILNIILPYFNIDRIVIPYQDIVLETRSDKWRKLGIISPYCNQAVDKQVILSLDKINLEEEYEIKEQQLNLFSGGAA